MYETGGKKILIVEDEEDILDLIAFNLQKEGYQVDRATDGVEAVDKIRRTVYALIILDIMLPEKDGFEVLKEIKSSYITRDIPVIILTARGEEVDRIVGLELGADDYVVKPFSVRELSLRIKAILRRTSSTTNSSQSIWKYKGLKIDTEKREVYVDEKEVELTLIEMNLLLEFIKNQGRILTREYLLNRVWGYDFEGYNRTVDTHITRLRTKIHPYSSIIKTVRGMGYKLKT